MTNNQEVQQLISTEELQKLMYFVIDAHQNFAASPEKIVRPFDRKTLTCLHPINAAKCVLYRNHLNKLNKFVRKTYGNLNICDVADIVLKRLRKRIKLLSSQK